MSEPTDTEMLDWLDRKSGGFEFLSPMPDLFLIVIKTREAEMLTGHGKSLRECIKVAMK